MERPERFTIWGAPGYKASDIDPLLDELERLKADKKPFPSYEEFNEWYHNQKSGYVPKIVYAYFAQFQYETVVFPKVGEEYEFGNNYNRAHERGKLNGFAYTINNGQEDNTISQYIRPITRPTREEVIAKYGITPEELEILNQY